VPMPATERWLLKLILTNDDLVGWVADRLDLSWIQHPAARHIVGERISAFRADSWKGVAGFLETFEDEESRNLITEAVTDRRKITDPEKTLKGDPDHSDKRGILERLRDEALDRQVAVLQQRANQPEMGDPERLELLRQQQNLRSLKRQPLSPGA